MNALIAIEHHAIDGEEVQTVDARKLHAFLKVGRAFSNWIKGRIAEYGFVDGQDFVTAENLSTPNPARSNSRAQRTIEYHLTLDMAKELSMVERTEKGREARRYFIECERIALGKITPAVEGDDEPSTVKDRAPLLHDAIDVMVTLRISLPNAYRAFSQFAGVRRFPSMTKRQAAETTRFSNRLLKGEATQRDFERIARNRATLYGEETQQQLAGVTLSLPGGLKKRKGKHW